jgi:hypothetical protein
MTAAAESSSFTSAGNGSRPLADDVADRVGYRQFGAATGDDALELAGRREVVQQFAHEERRSAALVVHTSSEAQHAVAGKVGGQWLDESDDVLRRQRAELDARHGSPSADFGEELVERLRRADLVRAVAHEEDDARIGHVAHEVPEQLHGRSRSPLRILDGQHDRSVLRQPVEELGNGLEEVEAGRRGAVVEAADRRCREERPERSVSTVDREAYVVIRSGEVAQRHRERLIRHGQLAVARAGQNECTVGVRELRGLCEQPGLAHAGLARDQNRGRGSAPGFHAPLQHGGDRGGAPDEGEPAV